MGNSPGPFIEALTSRYRVLVIGGLAVIAHGFNRSTKDADIWLEPLESPEAWAAAVEETCSRFAGLTLHGLPGWRRLGKGEAAAAAREAGLLRIIGLACPLDLFREPNEFPAESFDEVFARATPNRDGTRLPDPIDLIVTKLNTGRERDLDDSRHLEAVVRERYRKVVPTAPLDEVVRLFDRFLDWEVCRFALENPNPSVRDYAISCLKEMAAEGDPFSQALLDGRNVPYD